MIIGRVGPQCGIGGLSAGCPQVDRERLHPRIHPPVCRALVKWRVQTPVVLRPFDTLRANACGAILPRHRQRDGPVLGAFQRGIGDYRLQRERAVEVREFRAAARDFPFDRVAKRLEVHRRDP